MLGSSAVVLHLQQRYSVSDLHMTVIKSENIKNIYNWLKQVNIFAGVTERLQGIQTVH